MLLLWKKGRHWERGAKEALGESEAFGRQLQGAESAKNVFGANASLRRLSPCAFTHYSNADTPAIWLLPVNGNWGPILPKWSTRRHFRTTAAPLEAHTRQLSTRVPAL